MPKTDVLAAIAANTRRRIAREKNRRPQAALERVPLYRRPPADFRAALTAGNAAVIAEIKFASPSQGVLRPGASAEAAVKVARSYLAAGARALSILTEPKHFAGSLEYLRAVRLRFPQAPLLMKDFFIDPYQFHQARAAGADAVLLIAALLGARLGAMLREAEDLGLTALVEVHDEKEKNAALRCGARLIGVNSRNLRTLKTDLGVARSLAPKASERTDGRVWIAESGISSRRDIDGLAAEGYKAFLVGTSLMRESDPGHALKKLVAG